MSGGCRSSWRRRRRRSLELSERGIRYMGGKGALIGWRGTLVILLLACSACKEKSEQYSPDPGWHYRWTPYRNEVRYGLNDGGETEFVGYCGSVPVFILRDGNWPFATKSFTLNIDGRSWQLAYHQLEHGKALVIDNAALADRFAKAKRLITFRANNGWERRFRPAPELSRFVDECRSLRMVDPDALARRGALQNSRTLY